MRAGLPRGFQSGDALTQRIYFALLRGINVGGNHPLPMHLLRRSFGELGCTGVRTYIQSGNVVFRSGTAPQTLAAQIGASVEREAGFAPDVLIRPGAWLAQALRANPFAEAEAEPARLHLYFLVEPPADADVDKLAQLARPSERFVLTRELLYLDAPEGIGRSRLATKIESAVGVTVTARNWRTASRLLEMVKEM